MQQLTPEEALEKAKQIYTEGVVYKPVFVQYTGCTHKVCASDVHEYSINHFFHGFKIYAAAFKGILYDSKTDQWAAIIVKPNPLEVLKQQETELLKKLADNREKQRKIKLAEIEKKFGISVGDLIEYDVKKGIVSRIEAYRPYPFYYLPFKKDGKPASQEVCCYSLEKIKLIEKKATP